jgi:hypothetical protein
MGSVGSVKPADLADPCLLAWFVFHDSQPRVDRLVRGIELCLLVFKKVNTQRNVLTDQLTPSSAFKSEFRGNSRCPRFTAPNTCFHELVYLTAGAVK